MFYGFGFAKSIIIRDICASLAMLVVGVSAIITKIIVDKGSLSDFCFYLGKPKWYLLLTVIVFFYYSIPFMLEFAFKGLRISSLSSEKMYILVSSFTLSFFAAFGEELGWRGYLLREFINKRYGIIISLIRVGIIWGIWHFPIALGPLLKQCLSKNYTHVLLQESLLSCVQMLGAGIALSIIFGAVYLKYNSIFLNSYLHGLYIGVRDTSLIILGATIFSLPITVITIIALCYVSVRWVAKFEKTG